MRKGSDGMATMQRRTFIKSIAAAFGTMAVGKLPAMPAERRINYDRFCTNTSIRYDLDSPWSQNGTVYASDYQILITHPGEFTGDGSARVPDLSKLWWGEFDSRGWREWPDQQVLVAHPDGMQRWCPKCHGKGRLGSGVRECPKCHGDFDEYFGDDAVGDAFYYDIGGVKHNVPHHCPTCRTGHVGGLLCGTCKGDGHTVESLEIVGGQYLSGWYCDSIRQLGGADYRVLEDADDNRGGTFDVVAFRFADGGRGFVMPYETD